DFENELLLAHAGRARDVEPLRDLGQRADAHVLQRRELQLFRRGRRGAGAAVALRHRLLLLGCRGSLRSGCLRRRRLRLHPHFVVLSISFHSSSSPSPVSAETGSTEVSITDSRSLSARIRSPRASLSNLVATTPQRATVCRSHRQASTSF